MRAKSFSFSKIELSEDFLFPPSLSLEEIKKLLLESKDEVKAANKNVFALLESEHKTSSALELKNKLVLLDKYMTGFADFLDERLDETEGSEKETTLKAFRKTCDQLTNRIDKMNRVLSDDISMCQHKETKEAIDPFKVATFVVAFPVAIGALAKIVFGEKSVVVSYATYAGAAIGMAFSFKQKINDFACSTYTKISNGKNNMKNSFLVYYVSSVTKERANMAKRYLGKGVERIRWARNKNLNYKNKL